jgi:hypothetical protein
MKQEFRPVNHDVQALPIIHVVMTYLGTLK